MTLIYEMVRFLQACLPRPMASISCIQPLYHHITLTANAEARWHAKQWLVQQLYYNTDRAFSTFPALDASDEFVECTAECAGPWIHISESCQVTWPYALEDIKQLFLHPDSQKLICFADELDVERDGNTVLARRMLEEKYPWHLLQGHFHEADRFIFVIRHLNSDEAGPSHGNPNFHEMEWIDVRRISPTRSVLRFLWHKTMLINFAKVFAKDMGVDISSQDAKSIEQEVSTFEKRLLWESQQQLMDQLAKTSSRST
ncbi:hypothetical protein Ae201684_005149 [Aphanomyces euteiches]|uniref:Uncharacterized protein n=1 Tax=Aphanomyces euteiches TaxID=100861 RepID=A0A6G0XGC8_9STRA|nr:hypothetical protein Ae201684_005149 [Aphanomyces euteiches]